MKQVIFSVVLLIAVSQIRTNCNEPVPVPSPTETPLLSLQLRG